MLSTLVGVNTKTPCSLSFPEVLLYGSDTMTQLSKKCSVTYRVLYKYKMQLFTLPLPIQGFTPLFRAQQQRCSKRGAPRGRGRWRERKARSRINSHCCPSPLSEACY